MLAGELKVSAYTDLGGLGTKQGPAASYFWTVPNLLPALLPWLVVLGLLALPSNRQAGAWWIWVPLAVMGFSGIAVQTAAEAANNDELSCAAQLVVAATLGLAAIWLMGAALARRWRAWGILLALLVFAGVSLLALCVGPAGEQLSEALEDSPQVVVYTVLLAVLCGLVHAGALQLTGWRCRKQFSRLRCSLWLPVWLWVMWLVGGGLSLAVVALLFNEGAAPLALLMVSVMLALVSFALMLPYLILSFVSSFYLERLKRLLRLPVAEPLGVIPRPVPVDAQESGANLPG
jgi:hypothetical protein